MTSEYLQNIRAINRPLLITGNTGFKGAWLTQILDVLHIPNIGIALSPNKGSLFDIAQMHSSGRTYLFDLRDYEQLINVLEREKPIGVIHLAAQPLVLEAYKNTPETFSNNVMSTVTLLEAIRKTNSVQGVAVITTDKVYENKNDKVKYKEIDRLKGIDPYSASKVAVESVVDAYRNIYYAEDGPRVISLRSGNVIGGGDVAANRLIPDAIRSHRSGLQMMVRNPGSTRPWMHVIDPLLGYLEALEHQIFSKTVFEALNFGPMQEGSVSVEEVLRIFQNYIAFDFEIQTSRPLNSEYEAKYLDLDSTLARELIGWQPKFNSKIALELTAQWWQRILRSEDPNIVTKEQIIQALGFKKK